jgi:hypothetical protein
MKETGDAQVQLLSGKREEGKRLGMLKLCAMV